MSTAEDVSSHAETLESQSGSTSDSLNLGDSMTNKGRAILRPVGHPSPVTQLFDYILRAWNFQKGDHCSYKYISSRTGELQAAVEICASVMVRLPEKPSLLVKDTRFHSSRVLAQNGVAQLALERLAEEDLELKETLEQIAKETEERAKYYEAAAISMQTSYPQSSSPRPMQPYQGGYYNNNMGAQYYDSAATNGVPNPQAYMMPPQSTSPYGGAVRHHSFHKAASYYRPTPHNPYHYSAAQGAGMYSAATFDMMQCSMGMIPQCPMPPSPLGTSQPGELINQSSACCENMENGGEFQDPSANLSANQENNIKFMHNNPYGYHMGNGYYPSNGSSPMYPPPPPAPLSEPCVSNSSATSSDMNGGTPGPHSNHQQSSNHHPLAPVMTPTGVWPHGVNGNYYPAPQQLSPNHSNGWQRQPPHYGQMMHAAAPHNGAYFHPFYPMMAPAPVDESMMSRIPTTVPSTDNSH